MNSLFDSTAADFDSHRALPIAVPEAIRAATLINAGKSQEARVLDLGAGTGRIGRAFVQADDSYVGVDSSISMLREFAVQCPTACLIQADGQLLPFSDGAFHLVLLMQVLSGASSWSKLLHEALRVVSRPGAIVVGQTLAPPAGVDAQMKRQLSTILKEMRVAIHKPDKSRNEALAWLGSRCSSHRRETTAQWTASRSPEQFIARHKTGARFVTLTAATQREALERLSDWANVTFGSLNNTVQEDHMFVLDIFEVSQENRP